MVIWTEDLQARMVDLLFETNISRYEIALELGCAELDVIKRIRELGLGWVRKSDRKVSRGQASLMQIMRKLLPGQSIVTEEPLPERLRLDIYCPKYKLAAEYHGRQHFQYVEHFHGNIAGFHEHQRRDLRKQELCNELGIALVTFSFCDDLTEDVVYSRMLDALQSTSAIVEPEPNHTQDDHYYRTMRIKQREYRKQQYRKMKLRRYGQ